MLVHFDNTFVFQSLLKGEVALKIPLLSSTSSYNSFSFFYFQNQLLQFLFLATKVLNNEIKNQISEVADVIPNGAKTFFAKGIATFFNGPANLINNDPKNPPD